MSININKFVLGFLLLAFIVACALCITLVVRSNNLRIAYVRSYDLINGYQGTMEARKRFEEKKETMMANVDSLRVNVERAKTNFDRNAAAMTPMARENKANELNVLHQQYLQYGAAIESKIKEEDTEIMSAVLGQVNSFVEAYAKENGLNMVVGTTLSGNLLYGDADLDITDDLLQRLNETYKGK